MHQRVANSIPKTLTRAAKILARRFACASQSQLIGSTNICQRPISDGLYIVGSEHKHPAIVSIGADICEQRRGEVEGDRQCCVSIISALRFTLES
jgi:hypothetical protein